MKHLRPLNCLILILFVLVPEASHATVGTVEEPSQAAYVRGLAVFGLAVGDIVVIGGNLSPEVPPSRFRRALGFGLGLASLAVASHMEDSGPGIALALGGSIAILSSIRGVHSSAGSKDIQSPSDAEGEILSRLSFSVHGSGQLLTGRF